MTNSGAVKTDAVALARNPIVLEDLLENGQGVGRIDGFVTFVTGGLPGERVRIAVDEVKRSYASAHAIAVEEPSPDRVDAGCPVFPRCGGCQTLHLRYAAECAWKRRRVLDALARIGGLKEAEVADVVTATPEGGGYRNKVSLVCKFDGGAARLGFYGARTHRLVAIDACPVLVPRLQDVVARLVRFAREAPQALRGVEHVVARASATGSELVISFNGKEANRALHAAVPELQRYIPQLTGIASSWDPPSENAVFGRRSATLWGSPVVRERVLDATFTFGIASFFQINTALLELLASRIVDTLSGARRVVDLYSGVGTFGVLLGMAGVQTTGVESFKPAVDEAAANAAENGVTNAAFECAPVAVALAGDRGRTLLAGADAAILDPPRKGCEEGVLSSLAGHGIKRVLYVSCNPATLARDAALLADAGYSIVSVQPFDMFPHTGHVEVLTEFQK